MASLSIAKTDPFALVRFFVRVFGIVAILGFCLLPHILWRIFRQKSPWPRLFLKAAARICGARVSIIGKPLHRDVFYVSNHLSWIDIPIIGGITGTSFISQDGISSWPLIGWLARINRTIFISRTDKMSVAEQVNQLRNAMSDRNSITIFPEGTTTDGRSLLPFKASLFATLAPPLARLYVQPILLDFYPVGPEIAWIGEETAPQNAWRIFTRKDSFDVRVHFLEAFDPAVYADRKAIACESRTRIAASLSASLGGMKVN
jgi:lyso-ornithine lipid O-acyltransferase